MVCRQRFRILGSAAQKTGDVSRITQEISA
jgi:hypothetical protein